MKFGVREICDVVLKTKSNQKIGNKIFYKGEPVIYFDTLKTSTLEGESTTVYAQGGHGNARLMAWEGERTLTFTMEDALISPVSFMILSGAGLIEASEQATIKQHVAETTDQVYYAGESLAKATALYIRTAQTVSKDPNATICIFPLDNENEMNTEPFIGSVEAIDSPTVSVKKISDNSPVSLTKETVIKISGGIPEGYQPDITKLFATAIGSNGTVLVDYYTEKASGAQQIEITPDKFGGYYYLEASTLFRNTDGVDMPAEFIIPSCKIQSKFSFQMSSSGDPSTFTFTMDAFPDYTKFDHSKKVLAAIQIIGTTENETALTREATATKRVEEGGVIVEPSGKQA